MAISARDVKALREKTGAGMMNCKTALSECDGDLEAAVDYLRKKGLAAAQKKQSRVAAEGVIVNAGSGNKAVLLEVNCETDFVSKGDDFQGFSKGIADYILANGLADIAALKAAKTEEINELTLKCGEKIDIRRFVVAETNGVLGTYNHGGKIGVLVDLKTTAEGTGINELAKDLAMHVAAADPKFLSGDDIDEAYKNREAAIYTAQLKEEGKPEQMIPKIVEGKLNKLAKDVCLLEQVFVKNSDLTIKKLLAETAKTLGTDIAISSFHKLNLGAGIEKKEDNLADEVAKMTKGQ